MAITWDDEVNSNSSKETHLVGLEKQYGLDNGVLKGLWNTESAKGTNMRTKLSSAKGHFQFIDSTAKMYGLKNPDDFYEASDAAARYLKDLKDQFGGDIVKAIAAYKAGPGAVQKNGIAAPAMGKNADAAYINKVLGTPNAAKIVWDESPNDAVGSPKVDNTANTKNQFASDPHAGMEHPAQPSPTEFFDPVQKGAFKIGLRTPWGQSAMIHAGRVASGFIEQGKKASNFLGRVFEDDPAVLRESFARDDAINAKRADETHAYEPFQISSPIGSGLVGGALPYLVTGPTIGPVAAKAAAGLGDLIGAPMVAGARAATDAGIRGASGLSASSNPLTRGFGKMLERDVIQPTVLARETAKNSRFTNVNNPMFADLKRTLTTAPLTGALEGASNIDTNATGGALEGVVGGVAGKTLRPFTNRIPSYYSKPNKELIDWYQKQGANLLPGEMTGSSTHQQIESQLRKSIGYSNEFQVHDASKNLTNSRIAYQAMGISPEHYFDKETKMIKQVAPEVLDAHRNSLKSQYNALEASTTPVFDKANLASLDAHVKAIAESPFTEAAKYSKLAQKAVDMAKSTLVQNRSSLTGRLETGKNFDGTTYKNIRSMLKDGIDGAYKVGDTNAAKQLQPLLQELDQAAERGVARAKGTTSAKHWKDLNTKYAMTNLVLEHGMGTNGIDTTRLYSHLRSNDAMRLFLDKGPPRLQALQKLAKVGDILAHQDKSFGAMKQPKSLGVFTSIGQMTSVPGLSQLTKLGAAPLLWAYKKGYPGTTGFLNMHPEATLPVGPFRAKLGRYWEGPGIYTHAAAQSGQTHDKILRGGINAAKYVGKGINDTSDIVSKGLADLLRYNSTGE